MRLLTWALASSVVLVSACYGAEKKESAPAAAGSVALYDTMAPAELGETVPSLVVEGKWKLVEEGAKPGSFAGDAVLVNRWLGVVIRRDWGGAEVYSKGAAGWTRRARVMPVVGGKALRFSALKATANDGTDGAVRVAVEGGRGMVFSLGAGDPIVKAVAEGKVECLRVEAPCRFGVLPDFFADDLLVDATTIAAERTEIPSDNFFLHMVGEGEAIVAAVWEKNVRDVELSVSGGGTGRRIKAADVFYGDQGAIWVAVLEEKGIWYAEELTKEDSEKGRTLDKWAVPFMAKWKGNFTKSDGTVTSYPLVSDKGAYAFAGQRFPFHNHGLKASSAEKGKFTVVLLPEKKLYSGGWEPESHYGGPMVAYPIARFDTPIERLCVEDLLVRCLGVGPCAYVLDVEAAKPIYKGIFTCSYGKTPGMFIPDGPAFDRNLRAAETWKEDRAFMKNETRAVATFIKFIEDRINAYVALIADLLVYLDQAEKKHPQQAAFIGRLRTALKKPTPVFQGKVAVDVKANGSAIFAPWMAEMMKAMRVDTPEQAGKGFAAAAAPQIGDPQDARVAGLRLTMKLVRSMATMEMARNPAAAEIAREVRKRIEDALRNPSNYERDTQWVTGGQ